MGRLGDVTNVGRVERQRKRIDGHAARTGPWWFRLAQLILLATRLSARWNPSRKSVMRLSRPSEQFCESSGEAEAIYRQRRFCTAVLTARGERRARAGLDRANNRNRNRSLNPGRKTGESRAAEYHRVSSVVARGGFACLNEVIQRRGRIASDLVP